MGKTLASEIKQYVTANVEKPSVARALKTLFNHSSKAFCSFFERLFGSTSGIVFSPTSKSTLWTAIKRNGPQEKEISSNAKYRTALAVRVVFAATANAKQTKCLYEIQSLIECICLAFFDESIRGFAKNLLDIPRSFAVAFLFCGENSAREWMLVNWLDSAAPDHVFWRDPLHHQFVHSEYFLELLYRDSNETQAPLLAASAGKTIESQRFVMAAWLFYLYRLAEKTNKLAVTVDYDRTFATQAQQDKKRVAKNRFKPNWTMSQRRVNETLDELTELFSVCLSMLYGNSLLAVESTLMRYNQQFVGAIADVAEEIRVFLMRQSSATAAADTNHLLRSLYDRVFDYRQTTSNDEMSLFKTEDLSLDALTFSLFDTGQSIELARLAMWLQATGFADVRLDYLIRYNAGHEASLEPLIQNWCEHIGVWRLAEHCYVSAVRQTIDSMVAQYASLSADAYFVGASRSLGTFVISSRRRMEALRSCMLNHRLRIAVRLHTSLHERTQLKDTVLYPLVVRSFLSARKSDSTQESLLAVTKNTVDFLCVMMGIRRVRGRQRQVEELSEEAELSLFKSADRLVYLCVRGYQLRNTTTTEAPMWLLEQVMRSFLLVREEHCISLGAVWEMHALFRQNARWRERFPQVCQLMEILLENCEGWKRDFDPLLETNTVVESEDTLFDRLKRKMVNEEVRRQRQRSDTLVPMDAATRRVVIALTWDDLFRSKTQEIKKRYDLAGSGSAAASSSAADEESDDIASSSDEPTAFSPLFENVRRSKRARQAEVNRLIYEFFLHALDDEIDYRDDELVKVVYNCLQDFELHKEKLPSDLLEVNRPNFETNGVVPLVWPSPLACTSFADSFLANCTPHYDSANAEQASNACLRAFTLFLRTLETSATARFCANESDSVASDLSLLQQHPVPVSYDSSLWLSAMTPSTVVDTVDSNIFGSESAYCVNSVLRLADDIDDFMCYGKGGLGFLSLRDFITHKGTIFY